MKKELIDKIDATLSSIEQPEKLTLTEIANLSYVSPSTVSRYVRYLGFSNFNDFKLSIILSSQSKEYGEINSNHINNMCSKQLFANLEQNINMLVDSVITSTIYLYYDREFELIARNFSDLLAKSGQRIVIVDEHYDLTTICPQNSLIFTIGTFPESMYFDHLQYASIVYTHLPNFEMNENVIMLPITTNTFNSYNLQSLNIKITTVQLLLSTIFEKIYIAIN